MIGVLVMGFGVVSLEVDFSYFVFWIWHLEFGTWC